MVASRTAHVPVLAMMALAVMAVLFAWQGTAWHDPALTSQASNYPHQDCGWNWSMWLELQQKGEDNSCLLGMVSKAKVAQRAAQAQKIEPHSEGVVYLESQVMRVLAEIAARWGH
jgi:hypothetical protein